MPYMSKCQKIDMIFIFLRAFLSKLFNDVFQVFCRPYLKIWSEQHHRIWSYFVEIPLNKLGLTYHICVYLGSFYQHSLM